MAGICFKMLHKKRKNQSGQFGSSLDAAGLEQVEADSPKVDGWEGGRQRIVGSFAPEQWAKVWASDSPGETVAFVWLERAGTCRADFPGHSACEDVLSKGPQRMFCFILRKKKLVG